MRGNELTCSEANKAKTKWANGAYLLYMTIRNAVFGPSNPCREKSQIEICPLFNNSTPKKVKDRKTGLGKMKDETTGCELKNITYPKGCLVVKLSDAPEIETIINNYAESIRHNSAEKSPIITALKDESLGDNKANAIFLYTDGRYTDQPDDFIRYFMRLDPWDMTAAEREIYNKCQLQTSLPNASKNTLRRPGKKAKSGTNNNREKELKDCISRESPNIPQNVNFIAPMPYSENSDAAVKNTLNENVRTLYGTKESPSNNSPVLNSTGIVSSNFARKLQQTDFIFVATPNGLEQLKNKIGSRIQSRIERARASLPASSQAQPGQQPAPVASQCCQSLPPQCLPVTARADSYGDVVAVGRRGDWHCSGVAVAQQWVLTARHCLPAEQVMAGIDIREGVEARRIIETVVPPDPSLDVALVRLDGRLDATIHLRRRATDQSPPSGVARLVGFGAIDSQGQYGFGRRHNTDLPITGWGCDPGRATTLGCLPASELVIPGSGGRDTCDGDSGGPVFELMPLAAQCCAGRLLGITSRPMATSRTRCGGGGVYVRVDQLDAWIEKTTHQQTAPSMKENE